MLGTQAEEAFAAPVPTNARDITTFAGLTELSQDAGHRTNLADTAAAPLSSTPKERRGAVGPISSPTFNRTTLNDTGYATQLTGSMGATGTFIIAWFYSPLTIGVPILWLI